MAGRDRLDKFLAHHARLTRTLARRAIQHDAVTVDGVVITDSAHKVDAHQDIRLDGTRITVAGPRYLMLHKPEGLVCDRDDSHHGNIFDLVGDTSRELHVAGRLDADTTGLVLLTDDGQWSHRITAPRHKQTKEYHVTSADPIAPGCVDAFARGLMLKGEDHPTLPATLSLTGSHSATLTLQEGRYHQVKRMFAATGNRVTRLHRDAIGTVRLDPALAPGQWRALTLDERLALGGTHE